MPVHDAQRRVMLRGMVAAGCTLCVLPTMWGCGRKEQSRQQGATRSSGPARGSAVPATADAAGKMSKAQAKYQEQPKGDQKCCTSLPPPIPASWCKARSVEMAGAFCGPWHRSECHFGGLFLRLGRDGRMPSTFRREPDSCGRSPDGSPHGPANR
jgi:hypothetical protein